MSGGLTVLSIEQLHPNDYNPNVMTEVEFKELVGEVQHLGRLPKPIVVRRNADGYVIVDGEHGWRAAKEVGLSSVQCEVIEADDIEAMRQTYKRNQHGTHNAVKLGRMFVRAIERSGISQRELAKQWGISEGTVRNALAYSKAAELRNSYAFEKLSLRQVRAFLGLPASVRDVWLDAGADLKLYDKLFGQYEWQYLTDIVKECEGQGLATTLEGTRDGFEKSFNRMMDLHSWLSKYNRYCSDLDSYVRPVAGLRLSVGALDMLPAKVGDDGLRVLLTPEKWQAILVDCTDRADDDGDFKSMVNACIQVALMQAGETTDDLTDPRVMLAMELLKGAPAFIRDSGLSLDDRVRLMNLTADVPEETMLKAKQEAVGTLRARDGWLTNSNPMLAELGREYVSAIQGEWSSVTVERALSDALDEIKREEKGKKQEALFADKERLTEAIIEARSKSHRMREGRVDGKPALDVLRERLAQMPVPEFMMLAGCVIDPWWVDSVWFNALEQSGAKVEYKQVCEPDEMPGKEQAE